MEPEPLPSQGVHRRMATSWTRLGCVVLGALPVLGLLLLFLPAVMLSGWFPEGAYVSDRPDLTFNTEPHEARDIENRFGGFLYARGVPIRHARDVRIASGTHYKHGLLFTFKLDAAQRKRLVRGLKRLPDPPRDFTGPGSDERGMLGAVFGDSRAVRRAELQYLRTKEPFNKLKWWPPRAAELNGMTVYEGPIEWHQSEISPSTCWIFVHPKRETVYVAADGA